MCHYLYVRNFLWSLQQCNLSHDFITLQWYQIYLPPKNKICYHIQLKMCQSVFRKGPYTGIPQLIHMETAGPSHRCSWDLRSLVRDWYIPLFASWPYMDAGIQTTRTMRSSRRLLKKKIVSMHVAGFHVFSCDIMKILKGNGKATTKLLKPDSILISWMLNHLSVLLGWSNSWRDFEIDR